MGELESVYNPNEFRISFKDVDIARKASDYTTINTYSITDKINDCELKTNLISSVDSSDWICREYPSVNVWDEKNTWTTELVWTGNLENTDDKIGDEKIHTNIPNKVYSNVMLLPLVLGINPKIKKVNLKKRYLL